MLTKHTPTGRRKVEGKKKNAPEARLGQWSHSEAYALCTGFEEAPHSSLACHQQLRVISRVIQLPEHPWRVQCFALCQLPLLLASTGPRKHQKNQRKRCGGPLQSIVSLVWSQNQCCLKMVGFLSVSWVLNRVSVSHLGILWKLQNGLICTQSQFSKPQKRYINSQTMVGVLRCVSL